MNDIEKLRHSTAHLLASAVKELFPKAKLAIGPPIEDGFYYDFDYKDTFTDNDLKKIEKKMHEIANKNLPFKKSKKTKKEAQKILKNEPYKLELLKDLSNITFYTNGNFTDLCSGPHISNTKNLKHFKLLKTARAYWKGNVNNKQLQRIYGTSFPTEKQLNDHLNNLAEAEKRDHRKIGEQLSLFFFHPVSPGAPFWLPNGMILIKELEKFWRDIHDKANYKEINTPIMVKESLFKKSGHTTHFKKDMFDIKVDNQQYYLKPMNCPEATLVYSHSIRSYKDLPLKLSEIGRLHRNELSGVLNGLLRVRQITMDDAHIFCTEDQIQNEIKDVLKITKDFYKLFDLKPEFYFATRPDKALGSPKTWKVAEKALEQALKSSQIKYKTKHKEGAFYGPKIDIHIKDTLKRDWQIATIQLDFQMPERFKLTYEGKDTKKHMPLMIHRAIFGSFERFIGILIEHFAGKFPLWLSPKQVRILTLTDRSKKFAKEIHNKLISLGIRSELDDRPESMGKKIRETYLEKIPITIVIGDKEIKSKTLAVRTLDGKNHFGIKVDSFTKKVLKNIQDKSIKISF